jgi:hypothetical protein
LRGGRRWKRSRVVGLRRLDRFRGSGWRLLQGNVRIGVGGSFGSLGSGHWWRLAGRKTAEAVVLGAPPQWQLENRTLMDKMAQARFFSRFDRCAPSSHTKKKNLRHALPPPRPAQRRRRGVRARPVALRSLSAQGCRRLASCTRIRSASASCAPPEGTMPPAPAYAVLAAAFRTENRIFGTRRNQRLLRPLSVCAPHS